ncbi:hypothetical protein BC629DRAFT_1537283 [Irpex lacteus]|nr:hypothetical protein BC629DRAFT_1537100 [Irpex lacteus]KAI0767972.1 hypothetical protein BC629DRAFT_1537283 [Irpex lacteus]
MPLLWAEITLAQQPSGVQRLLGGLLLRRAMPKEVGDSIYATGTSILLVLCHAETGNYNTRKSAEAESSPRHQEKIGCLRRLRSMLEHGGSLTDKSIFPDGLLSWCSVATESRPFYRLQSTPRIIHYASGHIFLLPFRVYSEYHRSEIQSSSVRNPDRKRYIIY